MSAVVDDDLWSAVGDPTRRRMLDLLLAEGRGTATALSQHLPVSRQAIAKHLAALGDAGLIERAPEGAGREVRYRLRPGALRPASAWLDETAAAWDERLTRLKRAVER